LLLVYLLATTAPAALADVEVLGLFKDAALLKKDGQQKLLRAGQSWNGITLKAADSKAAVAEINGETVTLGVSTRISTNYAQPKARQVMIPRNSARQYITTATINGRALQVLVDTGANIVAMNAATARRLGVDTEDAPVSTVTTASGKVSAWSVLLDSVDVGGIKIDRVQASVLEGGYPDMVLLGTTYLEHVHMQERDGVLMLTSKY
jgi:aspartyl protease family protein